MSGYLHWSSVAPWALTFGLTGLACGGMAIHAWRGRDQPGGVYAAVLMIAAAWYSLLYALELQAPTITQKMVWSRIEYLGVASLPLAWFLFARAYTGEIRRLAPWLRALLYAVPSVTVVLAATNQFHGLLWSDVGLEPSSVSASAMANYQHGPWFWVQVGYCYMLMLAGGLILIRAVLRYPSRYKWRASLVLVAAAAPWLGNGLYSFGFRPAGGVNVTALAFSVTAIAIGLSMAQFDFLRLPPALLPVARETLVQRMKDLVLAVDLDRRIVWANEAASAALGHPAVELAGRLLDDVVPGAAESVTLYREEGDEEHFETVLAVDGVLGTYDVVASSLRLKPRGSVGRLLVFRDVTERVEAEKALRDSEQQLRQSHKMEAVGQLAGGIAHDFNNLLTVVIGSASLLLEDMSPGDSLRNLVVDIKDTGERAANLTRQILAFSRQQELRPQVLSLSEIVRGIQPILCRTLGEDIDLDFCFAAELAMTEIDPAQMEQVLMNLVVNARDAMPGGGHLTIETANVTLEEEYCLRHPWIDIGPYVMLAVSDTGCGMNEATMARVFEPFFTTKELGKGTGLGLSTVYGIVKQSGGSISVYSEPSHGTTFKIYLPVALQVACTAESPDHELEKTRGGTETIVVVEDEAGVRELMVLALSRVGYRVHACGSWREVQAGLEAGGIAPDLLVTDFVLPGGVDGPMVAGRLRERYADLAVLFVSGYALKALAPDGGLDGHAQFLQKPFELDALLRKVREMLDAAGGAGQASTGRTRLSA